MLVSMNWIREYVDLPKDRSEIISLIQRFTLSTAEVEDIYIKGDDLHGVVIGQIVALEAHPNSGKLHLLKVDTGDKVRNIVCGAPNVALGQKVALAVSGSRVPGKDINTATVAGYESEGMCCSEAELGISDDASGLMVIPDDAPLGADIKTLWDIDDIVFEVDNKSLTNRPDLWGHYGIAREFAALTAGKLKPLDLADELADKTGKGRTDIVPVDIRNTDLVYRYTCLRMSGITKQVSPVNMRIRLYYCGMRAINLLADLTNYIMLELGQPTHAFNASKVNSIAVGTPEKELDFKTLDGTERKIGTNTLLIYNNDLPVGIAGIMGGLDSEIVENTGSVVLESANFDGVSIRKSSTALGLRTDASMRYEKVLDPELTILAVKRFVKLLCDIDAGAYIDSALNDVYVKKYPIRTISFAKRFVDRYTGIDISEERICHTLTLLGFDVKLENDIFTVVVPSWRATKDVTIKADIIEEITRIYGYDNFEYVTTKSALRPIRRERVQVESAAIKDILVKEYALHEVHSYIWSDGKKYKKLGIEVPENVRILNIPTPENGTLRRTMQLTMLSFIYENRGYADTYGLFEIGRVIDGTDADGMCVERRRLGVALYTKEKTEKELYLHGVSAVRRIFAELKHAEPEFVKISPEYSWQHPKNTSEIRYDGINVGTICTLHPSNLSKVDKNCAVVLIEIDIDSLSSGKVMPLTFAEPSKFPEIDIDLCLNLNENSRYDQISAVWKSMNIQTLRSASVVDIYESDSVRSIVVRLTFGHDDRTMSMEEITPIINKIVAELDKLGIKLRA